MSLFVVIVIILLLMYIFSIWDIREDFYLWMPTRNTRLMSYDIRGDPYGLIIYPPYFNYLAPMATYLYSGNTYDITGRYNIYKPKKRLNKGNQIRKVSKRGSRMRFRISPRIPPNK
jgi:hypothetical protein